MNSGIIGIKNAGIVPHMRNGEFDKIPLGANIDMEKYLAIDGPEMGR